MCWRSSSPSPPLTHLPLDRPPGSKSPARPPTHSLPGSHGPVQVVRGRAHADRAVLRRRRRRRAAGLPVLLVQRRRGRDGDVVLLLLLLLLVPVRVRRPCGGGGGGGGGEAEQVEAAVAGAGGPGHGSQAPGGGVQGVRRGGQGEGLLPQELQVDQGPLPQPRLRMVLMMILHGFFFGGALPPLSSLFFFMLAVVASYSVYISSWIHGEYIQYIYNHVDHACYKRKKNVYAFDFLSTFGGTCCS